MQEWLTHPAVQGGLAPFAVALVTAELLLRLRLSGLAIIAGFAATAYLSGTFSMSPLTAAHKIALLGVASGLFGAVLGLFNWSLWRPVLSMAGACAAAWVRLRVLQQRPLGEAMQWGVGWLVFWMDGLRDAPVRAGSAGMAIGLGTGAVALLGTSALLGQFGLALGTAASAFLLIQMISNSPLPCGRSYTLPLSLVAGLSGCLAVLSAQLPWHVLPALAAIPLAAKIPVPDKWALRLQALLLSVASLMCAAGAVYLTWRAAGASPLQL